ncbi:MAG: hypothetical protein ACKO38_07285 [Planctomycetota bacterium]
MTESEATAVVRRLLRRSACCSPNCAAKAENGQEFKADSADSINDAALETDIPLPPIEDRGEPVDVQKLPATPR